MHKRASAAGDIVAPAPRVNRRLQPDKPYGQPDPPYGQSPGHPPKKKILTLYKPLYKLPGPTPL